MLRVRSLDCQSDNIHLDVARYNEPALVRGTDDVIPRAEGRDPGARRKDVLRFTLEGFVKGTGEDRDERALSWRTNTDLLMAVMDFSLDPGLVEVGPDVPALFPDASPYLGLTEGRELFARCVSMVRGPVQNHMSHQSWSFEMECIDSPPQWQDSGSSS
jgi:hypothetical protein